MQMTRIPLIRNGKPTGARTDTMPDGSRVSRRFMGGFLCYSFRNADGSRSVVWLNRKGKRWTPNQGMT